jgi:tRNA U34 5-methylaminomethyl-2-thiouridine-forming methyltransferase MnmC
LQRKIIKTADGSKTIYLPDWNEHYHSKHGAVQEAYHVFIKHGLQHRIQSFEEGYNGLAILEIGFGTGLNALITLHEAEKLDIPIQYTGVEAYPVTNEEVKALDYPEQLSGKNLQEKFNMLHESTWEKSQDITKNFSLEKRKQQFSEINDQDQFDLIYFDAFGPRVQPELWTKEIFMKMFRAIKLNGVLVTYSAKGSVRRALLEVGFAVERLPGPPGKREMLRATLTVIDQ